MRRYAYTVTQDSNNHVYPRRLPETDGAEVLLTSDQGAYTSQALTRWRHLARIRKSRLLLIYRPRRDERLSWLTCSGRFTHIVVTRRLQAERRTGSVCRPKTGVLPTVLRNQPDLAPLLRWHRHCVFAAVEHQVAMNM